MKPKRVLVLQGICFIKKPHSEKDKCQNKDRVQQVFQGLHELVDRRFTTWGICNLRVTQKL